MSEKFSSKQDRSDAIDEVHDFVAVDSMGRARVPTGSGSRGGKFLSDHEVKMIEAHASEIYDGLDNRENEALLDAVGVLEKPKHIRKSLEQNGFIDEDDDWTKSEVMSFVDDARKDVEAYYASRSNSEKSQAEEEQTAPVVGKRRADVEVDAPSQAEGYVRRQDREEGRHRADAGDENSPLYDRLVAKFNREALSQEAEEGESSEEYEARHTGGRHAAPLPVSELEAIANGQVLPSVIEPLPVSELEAIAAGAAESARSPLPTGELEAIAAGESRLAANPEDGPVPRSRVRRGLDWFTLAGAAANAEAAAEHHRRSQPERRGKHGRVKVVLGAAALAAVGVIGGIIAYKHGAGQHGSGGGFGDFFNDIADNIKDGTKHLSDLDIKDKSSGVATKAQEIFGSGSVEVRQGDGYTQVLDRILDGNNIHLSSNELYELHKHLEHVNSDYINLDGINDSYTMPNGDSGLSRPDDSARISDATQKAVVRWLQLKGKL